MTICAESDSLEAPEQALVTRMTPSDVRLVHLAPAVLVGLGDRLEPERAAGAVDDDVEPVDLAASSATESGSATSRREARPPTSPASSSQRSSRRAAAIVSNPAAASARTVAAPIPLEAPVTRATGGASLMRPIRSGARNGVPGAG